MADPTPRPISKAPRWFQRLHWSRYDEYVPRSRKKRREIESFEVHSQDFQLTTYAWSASMVGRMWHMIMEACRDGDVRFVAQFKFVRRIKLVPFGRRSIPIDVRRAVWERDGGRCVQCDSDERVEFDHIVAVVHGGKDGPDNIQLLCKRCNIAKGPKSYERRRLAARAS